MKRKLLVIIVVLMVIAGSLIYLCSNPVFSCTFDLPETYETAIRHHAKGLYSKTLPLVPVFVKVTSFDGVEANYTIFYFPFGEVGFSYIAGDGFAITKYLAGWM